jgi:hypothetical protein
VTLIAHAGHWLTTIAYFVPVVVFLGWLIVTQVRDRRNRKPGPARESSHLDQPHPGQQRGEGRKAKGRDATPRQPEEAEPVH